MAESSSSQNENIECAAGEHEFEELTQITNELLTTQRRLHQQSAELRKLNDEKNLAIGIVAHDLRNPLALIEMESEFLLRSSGLLNEAQLDLLTNIHRQGQLMLSIVNDLLDVAAIDAGFFELTFSSTKIGGLVERNVQRNALLAAQKNVQIRLHGPAAEFDARIDSNKFEQVLNNLIGNAVKYGPADSVVDVSLQASAQEFQLQVRDNGPGIPYDKLKTLFEPFVTGNVAPGDGQRSTGLGLTIVKRIVEKHGGSIQVSSEEGSGSCFTVRLPRWPLADADTSLATKPVTERGPVALEPSSANVQRVLIVDDNVAMAKMTARMLQSFCDADI